MNKINPIILATTIIIYFLYLNIPLYTFAYQNNEFDYSLSYNDESSNPSNKANDTEVNPTTDSDVSINIEPGFGYKYIKIFYDNDIVDKAKSKININVQPLFLAFLRYNITWNDFSINGEVQNSFGIGGQSNNNNDIYNNSVINSRYSYLFLFAVGYLGFESKFSYDVYTLGTAKYSIDFTDINQNKKFSGHFPFITKKQQFDLVYHFSPEQASHINKNANDVFFVLRYLNYYIPAILYIPSKEEDDKNNFFAAETLPYLVKYKTYSFGFGFENKPESFSNGWNFKYSFSLYLGKGKNEQTYLWLYRNINSTVKSPEFYIISPCATIGVIYLFKRPLLSQIKFLIDIQSYTYSIFFSNQENAKDGTLAHIYYSWWLSFVSQF
ncbi:MAG: hypothetical protein N3F66_07415 [Spirochaetes bacterium]|nr:hypothetical protein [Spirochaetota bacterium]